VSGSASSTVRPKLTTCLPPDRTLAHLLRFFAHLILVLRELKQPLPEFAANRILEAYVQVLEANDQVCIDI